VSSSIKRVAGEYLKEKAGRESMITAIRADIGRDLKNSTVYVTVFPEEKETEALNFLKRKRGDFREFFKSRIKLKTVPFFDFKIDMGEKYRQRIEEISEKF